MLCLLPPREPRLPRGPHPPVSASRRAGTFRRIHRTRLGRGVQTQLGRCCHTDPANKHHPSLSYHREIG